MVNKQLINGLKYEKLSEEQLYDLSQWELVDIIWAYRKDFQAKEQECEELKEKLKEMNEVIRTETTRCNLVNILKIELDQLKEELEQEKALKETYLACYKAKHEDIEGKLFKLKQTITEIKEIAEKEVNERMLFADKESFCDFNKILQKISECEGNDENL